jgi:hypothetical protein
VLGNGGLSSSPPNLKHHQRPAPLVRYRSAVADAQLVGQIIAAVVTFAGTGAAAFLGARVARRNTNVVDARAEETAEWNRIHWMVTMAVSTNPNEAEVGMTHLRESKNDWIRNPEQRAFIRRTCKALNAASVQAYRGGQTTVRTSPPLPPTPLAGP